MNMIPLPAYWQAVAQGIDAEEAKASLFIKHNQSVGAAREEILRDFLRRQTPEPYRVRSGFVHQIRPDSAYCSPQLDIVVYDPTVAQPDYQIGELVVVPHWPAKSIVEVKTELDGTELSRVLDAWDEVAWLHLGAFAFAFDGVTFRTFVERLATAMQSRPRGVPECIAVHGRNYIFVRSGYHLAPLSDDWHRPARHQLAVDFGSDEGARGQASGHLLMFYLERLRSVTMASDLVRWFNGLALPAESKVRFSHTGEVSYGNIDLS